VFCTIAFVAAVFVLRRPLARDAAIVLATVLSGAVGLSRLVLGVHWPTDVLAGWALGLSIALVVTFAAVALGRLAPQQRRQSGRRYTASRLLRHEHRRDALQAA
jgi:undecaprenyl-diphosphatase